MTTYTLRKGAADKTTADVVVVGVLRTGRGVVVAPGGETVASAYGRKFSPLLQALGFDAKPGAVAKVPTAGAIRSPLLMLVGLGDEVTDESLRRAAGMAARTTSNAASVALALPADSPDRIRAVTEGWILGAYSFDAYRSTREDDTPGDVVVLSDLARQAEAAEAIQRAELVASARNVVRDWVNNPPGDFTPAAFADTVVASNKGRGGGKTAKGAKAKAGKAAEAADSAGKVTVRVYDEKALAEEGCGGILGVGRGSDNPPRMVRLSYRPAGAKVHLGLVGKGITYDSGGLSIKPATSLPNMKSDMAGAAAVVMATLTIADLGLPVQVTAYAPMAENMISGDATRPGDVLTMRDGKTVEVLNTDAEGRLILADALAMATESKPDVLVDVATLTGACVTALGDRVAGVLGNDDELIARVRRAAERVGEPVWPLPIPEEMGEKVRSNTKVADLAQHNIDRFGGALYAAAFLREFVGETRWAHLDIAGPAYNEKGPYGYTPTGGTGYVVATLVELASELAGGQPLAEADAEG